jgi:hypothetical protein
MIDSLDSVLRAAVSIDHTHLDVFTRVANALNKQQPVRAAAMAQLLEQVLGNLDAAVEATRPKTLAERYEALPQGLKAKLKFENGRLHFTVRGTGIESKYWPERLKAGGHELSKWAKDILSKPDYDKKHRLEAGKVYKLCLVLGAELATDAERSTAGLKAFALREIGEQSVAGLKGELALLIREVFTNAELELMGIYYIAVLHEPIVDSVSSPRVLNSNRHDGSFVSAYCAAPGDQWGVGGAFAFLAK